MKHFLFSILVMLTAFPFSSYGKDINVKVIAEYRYPGEQYAEVLTPTIKVGTNVQMRYNYTLSGAKNDKDARILCTIRFPKDFEIKVNAADGVDSVFDSDVNRTVTMICTYTEGDSNVCEFFLPQKSDWTATVELSTGKIGKLRGKDVPVTMEFRRYVDSTLTRWQRDISTSLFGTIYVSEEVLDQLESRLDDYGFVMVQYIKMYHKGEILRHSTKNFTYQIR